MVSVTDGWAVGDSGAMLHWDGTSWQNVPSPAPYSLFSVAMVSETDGWSVGSSGAILHYTAVQTPPESHIYLPLVVRN